MPLAQATVSQHLKVLKEAGLVRGPIDGRELLLLPRPERIADLRAAPRRLLGGSRPRCLDDIRTRGDRRMTEPTTRSGRSSASSYGAIAQRRRELLRAELLRLRAARRRRTGST